MGRQYQSRLLCTAALSYAHTVLSATIHLYNAISCIEVFIVCCQNSLSGYDLPAVWHVFLSPLDFSLHYKDTQTCSLFKVV